MKNRNLLLAELFLSFAIFLSTDLASTHASPNKLTVPSANTSAVKPITAPLTTALKVAVPTPSKTNNVAPQTSVKSSLVAKANVATPLTTSLTTVAVSSTLTTTTVAPQAQVPIFKNNRPVHQASDGTYWVEGEKGDKYKLVNDVTIPPPKDVKKNKRGYKYFEQNGDFYWIGVDGKSVWKRIDPNTYSNSSVVK